MYFSDKGRNIINRSKIFKLQEPLKTIISRQNFEKSYTKDAKKPSSVRGSALYSVQIYKES